MQESLLELNGVGPVIASRLEESGFVDAASVGAAETAALAAVRGIGPLRAAALRAHARELTGPVEPPEPDAGTGRAAKAIKWDERAKELKRRAKQLETRARSAKSKKKRKRRLREAAEAKAAAKQARRKAKQLRAG